MTPLRRLTFECKGCDMPGVGSGEFEFRLDIPFDREEAELLLGGSDIEQPQGRRLSDRREALDTPATFGIYSG
jgi:hypothetical protein